MEAMDQSSLYITQVKQLEELKLAAVSIKIHKSPGFIGIAKNIL